MSETASDDDAADRTSTAVVSIRTRPQARAPISLASRVLTRGGLASLPDPLPLISNTLDLNTVAIIAGHFGSLKSFIVQSMAASVATGHAWHGRTVEPGPVLYVAGEGAHGLHKRLTAWESHYRTHIPDQSLHVLPTPVHLLQAAAVNELAALAHRNRYRLIIIDTLAKATTGIDENSAMDMGRAVAGLYDLQQATDGGTVIAVHHTGKDRTTIRGSSALEAGVDTVYIAEGDAAGVKLSRTKRKDGPTEDVHQLAFRAVDGTNSGLVLPDSQMILTGGRSGDLLSLFLSHFGAVGATSAALKEAAGMPHATFHRALNALVKAGHLRNTGTGSRPFYVCATQQ